MSTAGLALRGQRHRLRFWQQSARLGRAARNRRRARADGLDWAVVASTTWCPRMTSTSPTTDHPRDLRTARSTCRHLLTADYERGQYLFERVTLAVFRAGQSLRYVNTPLGRWLRRVVLVLDLVWTQALMGAELPHEVWAGPGLQLHHGGRGVILHPSVRIGDNVRIYHNVTIGVRDGRPAATVGDRAFLGTGATILGPVTIAAGTMVGAHAVVLTDTEPGSTYVGVPARSRRVDGLGNPGGCGGGPASLA